MHESQFSLSEYLSSVQELVRIAYQDAVWVKAEILKLNIKSGHYYFELAEKDLQSEKVIAHCKATLWKFAASKIVSKFEKDTAIHLSADLNVLIKIKARFDPQFGFSVNIEDIDSSYTLGEIAKRYQNILERLRNEGLLNKNKALALPFDLHNILVIAPENAAGLADFKTDADRLDRVGLCHFEYHAATFQGMHAANSIIQSLSEALRKWVKNHPVPPDLIVIIRGGGAVNDLAYLNNYALAALLCKRSVPIWVGIGHETDRTILDEVAQRSFDTPSKVIAAIRQLIIDRSLDALNALKRLQLISQQHIQIYQSLNQQVLKQIQLLSQQQLYNAAAQLDSSKAALHNAAQQQLKMAGMHIEAYLRETLLQNPKHILAKGYAIIRSEQKTIHSITQVNDSALDIQMQDGHIQAQIIQVQQHDR